MLRDEIGTMTSYKTKALPLPPPFSAAEDGASSFETSTFETVSSWSSNGDIPLSEYRERLLQRHKVYDPSAIRSVGTTNKREVELYLPLGETEDFTKPTALKRIDQEEDSSLNDQMITPTAPRFHLPAHNSPFTPEAQKECLPSPNLEGASASRATTIIDPELPPRPTPEKNDPLLADEFFFHTPLTSPHQETFLSKVNTRASTSASQLEDPFEYQSSIENDSPSQEGSLPNSRSLKRSFKKFSSRLKKSASSSTLKKSSSNNTFKTSVLPDLPKHEDYTYFTQQSKVEDQQSTFTAQTATTSRTSPNTSPQNSFSPPPPVPPKSPQYSYTSKHQSISTSTQSPIISSSAFMASPDSPFWKYHILKIGKDLYLTTNPGMKHMYCRNAPGYFIEVVSNDPAASTPAPGSGYSLIFKDSSAMKDDSEEPYMVITKKSQNEGGFFTFSTPRQNFLNQGTIMKFKDTTFYHGISHKEMIEENYFPYDGLRSKNPGCFKNYEVRDLHGVPWNIGSIPRIRANGVKKIRDKISTYYDSPHQGQPEDEFKFIGKRNIYFHQNFVPPDCQSVKYKEYEPKYIYGHDYGKSFPPVLSMFRPYENKMRKRMIQSVKNHSDFQGPYLDGVHDDYGTETSKFYQGSDGLYYVKNTSDDLPDENKLGWITIYEDDETFGGIDNRGMFDLVIGMTLAVGYDSCLSD
ncbi:hypothetical protein Cantr_04274 [Candida viswanathii]|uniref:Uncharacterized protein n=1 Tax=Candida viswanathii TaxID=5486 RepID=A0A367XM07_9ASCO|nr:hypothetical protein Cantr_04274 [Candida viswanathii]